MAKRIHTEITLDKKFSIVMYAGDLKAKILKTANEEIFEKFNSRFNVMPKTPINRE